MSIARFGKILTVWATLAAAFLVVSASAESRVRFIRLSEVQGLVQLDRNAGDGFDRAFLNLPVIEGSRLRTGRDGHAEVEFEDGSALRLTPNSEVDFTHLALEDGGQMISAVQLVSGTVYADLHPKKTGGSGRSGDPFRLSFGRESVSMADAAHLRVELAGATATVAVFKGKVTANLPSGTFEIAEKHRATIAVVNDDSAGPGKKDTLVIAKNYEDRPSDAWDREQTDYHDRYTSAGASSISSPYDYGVGDLSYYGNFMTVPGHGNVWRPYFVGVSWSPFQDGGWAFYPGAGYMWVSGYPWGWIPYNYGNWAFAPGVGYVWQPGNWDTRNALPRLLNAPAGAIAPAAPATGHQTVMVGLGLAANSAVLPSRLTINPGSAAFGVPRGSVNHLDHLAKKMEKKSRPVEASTVLPESEATDSGQKGMTSNVTPPRTPNKPNCCQ
jgi:hypothetical protein